MTTPIIISHTENHQQELLQSVDTFNGLPNRPIVTNFQGYIDPSLVEGSVNDVGPTGATGPRGYTGYTGQTGLTGATGPSTLGGDLGGPVVNGYVKTVRGLPFVLSYDDNGSVSTFTTAEGTKTMLYNGTGQLTDIIGTGIYASKHFTYDSNGKLIRSAYL